MPLVRARASDHSCLQKRQENAQEALHRRHHRRSHALGQQVLHLVRRDLPRLRRNWFVFFFFDSNS